MEGSSDLTLDTTIIEDTENFASLEQEWGVLYHHAPLATPFQSWAWLYSWWESYGEGYELRLITLRADDGLLVGIIPLMLERRWGFGRLLFIGSGGASDYLDLLMREGWEEAVSEAGSHTLQELDAWHVADLQELRPEAAAWTLLQGWVGPRTRAWQSSCPVIEVKAWEEMLVPLSKNLRKITRRAIRQIETDGVRRELARADDIDRAAHRWVALHREAWQDRDIVPVNLTQKFEDHLSVTVRRMTAAGLGAISEFWRDGEVVISTFWVFGKDFVGSYMLGASQEALRRYQVSSLYIWDGVNLAQQRGCARLDLLRGKEPYKLRWQPKVVPNHRVFLGRRRIFWAFYAGYRTLRQRARGYAESERTPRWIKMSLNWLRRR